MKGCCYVNIEYEGQTGEKPLLVVGGSGSTLLGRDWLKLTMYTQPPYSLFLFGTHPFSKRVWAHSTLSGHTQQAKIDVDPQAKPEFHPARSVPYALRDKVVQELQRLQRDGTIEPVDIAEWAAPLVVAFKQDKRSVRICGDFSVTINPVSKLDLYPIPRVEEIFARLSGGKYILL